MHLHLEQKVAMPPPRPAQTYMTYMEDQHQGPMASMIPTRRAHGSSPTLLLLWLLTALEDRRTTQAILLKKNPTWPEHTHSAS